MSREKLVALEKLQQIDLQIEALTKEAGAGPARVAELEAQVSKARSAADLERGKVADNERARRHLETQISDDKDKLKKWEQRLPQLKHQREFAALEREINGLKKANEAAEEELKTLKAAFDPLKQALQVKEAELAAREADLGAAHSGVQSSESGLRDRIATLQGERDKYRPQVDPKLYAGYENIRKKRGGKVLVPAVNGTCTGCNRRLAPQLANRLLVPGTVDTCPACLRLVFVPPAPPDTSEL